MRCVAFRHNAFTYMHGRIATERDATHEKRVRAGRGYNFTDWDLRMQGENRYLPRKL